MGYGLDYKNKPHQDERIKTCDDKHRNKSLEHIVLNYQLFRSNDISEEESEERQKTIWSILDKYYEELQNKKEGTEYEKNWRLYLARMDRRRMDITTEKIDDGIIIKFNPEIDQSLEEYREKSLEGHSEKTKYLELSLWATNRLENNDQYKKYSQYEESLRLVLSETKEIINKINKNKDDELYLFNHATPAHVCSVLVRDYFEQIPETEKEFCKNIVLTYACLPLQPNYQYQISDGTQSAFSVLSILFEKSHEDRNNIKEILLLSLLNNYSIDSWGFGRNSFPIKEIYNLSENNFADYQSLLFGYLLLKPKYDELINKIRIKNYNNIYDFDKNEALEEFLELHNEDLQKLKNNTISFYDIDNIKKLDLFILKNAFQLIPLKTNDIHHKEIVTIIISIFAKELLSNNRKDKVDYTVKSEFIEKFTYFVLSSKKEEIPIYLKPFLENFNNSESISDILKQFIYTEDNLNLYENFWEVWYLFQEKIIDICRRENKYSNIDKIIKSYLFSETLWKETTKDWHTLKENNKSFFTKIVNDIGYSTYVFYSIAKLLNNIGSKYSDNGISWLHKMMNDNKNLWTDELETDTVFFIEKFIERYIYDKKETIRKNRKLRQEVILILTFLVNKGSVTGYMLRESIL